MPEEFDETSYRRAMTKFRLDADNPDVRAAFVAAWRKWQPGKSKVFRKYDSVALTVACSVAAVIGRERLKEVEEGEEPFSIPRPELMGQAYREAREKLEQEHLEDVQKI